MISASTFGSADDTYLDLDYSGYHKSLIQWLFMHVISREIEFYNTVSAKRYSRDDRLIPRSDRKFLTRFKNFRYTNDAHNDKDVNRVYWSEAMRR